MKFKQPVRVGDTAGSVTASAEGGENIDVAGFNLPGTTPPNERISTTATIKNQRTVIAPTDPDVCDPQSNFNPLIDGLRLTARLLVDGREVDRGNDCVPGLGGENDISLSFTSPNVRAGQNRDVPVTLVVEGGRSGNELVRLEREVLVRSDSPSVPDPVDPDDGSSSECSVVDAINPANECSLDDAVGGGQFALAGGFAVLLVLVIVFGAL